MSQVGPVLSAEVQCHADTKRSKGWGLVEYENPAQAAQSVEDLNGEELGGRNIHIRLDRSNIESSGGFAVYVGNLPWATTDADLASLFAQYEPYDAHVKTNMSGLSRGFAILRFADPEMGQRAIAEMDNHIIEERPIQVRVDRETGRPSGGSGGGARAEGAGGSGLDEDIITDTIFVGNLAWGATDEDLIAHFSQEGQITSAQVQLGPSGRSKGWALVKFANPEDAARAVDGLNSSVLHERKLIVRLDRK
ncbi:unnamed protein product [Chrysoparadoxa australica]